MIRFSVFTPLDFVVRTSEEYWQKVILKHPDILGLENEVKATLSQPDQIRRSSRDPNILLSNTQRKTMGCGSYSKTKRRWILNYSLSNRCN